MSYQLVKANISLYAVLRNLEELPEYDPEIKEMIRDLSLSIQFSVLRGPAGYLEFRNGSCRFAEGKHPSPTVKLFFISPGHFNRMMDGGGIPIPLKGFSKLGFLMKDFKKITDRLEHYLKPDAQKLMDEQYREINTVLTLNTGAFAVREIAQHDKIGQGIRSHIMDGDMVMEVLPSGLAASIKFSNGATYVRKEKTDNPIALMQFKDMQSANDMLNNNTNLFEAAISESLIMKGQVPMIEAASLILGRIPVFLDNA